MNMSQYQFQRTIKNNQQNIADRYNRKIQNLIQNQHQIKSSQQSFSGIQTPGWTTVVHTQQSKQYRPQKNKNKYHKNILQKLNNLPPIDLQTACFQKIRLSCPNPYKQNHYNQQNIFNYESFKTQNKKQQRKQFCGHLYSSNKVQSRTNTQINPSKIKIPSKIKMNRSKSVGKFYIVPQNKNKSPQKQNKQNQNKKRCQSHRRFHTISVHEHLYQHSKKLQTKRIIEKIIDQKYKKQLTFRFTPKINQKSCYLAESKFSKNQENTKITISRCYNSLLKQNKSQKQKQNEHRQLKKNKQKYQKTIIEESFYYLSQNKIYIAGNEKQFQSKIQKLPLSSIKILSPLIAQIYRGKIISKQQFMEFFYTNSGMKQRSNFVQLIQKWIKRKDFNVSATKQNNSIQINQ